MFANVCAWHVLSFDAQSLKACNLKWCPQFFEFLLFVFNLFHSVSIV